MFATRLIPLRIIAKYPGGDIDLFRYKCYQCLWWSLVGSQDSPRVPDQTELQRKTEAILRATALMHQYQILVAEQKVFGVVAGLRRQGLKAGAL
jgi:hypothetical protein